MDKKRMFRLAVVGIAIAMLVVGFAPSSVIAQASPPPLDREMGLVVLSVEPSSMPADGVSTSVITATVWDKDGMLIGLVTVEFNTTLGTVTESSTTNSSKTSPLFGAATALLTAGETAGNATITAKAIIPEEPSPSNTTVVVLYAPGETPTPTPGDGTGGNGGGNGGNGGATTQTPTPTSPVSPTATPGETPSPSPMAGETATPSATVTATPAVTESPTPTLSPKGRIPGFEAVFVIASLLSVAYQVLRRRKK
jgi:hypothetical protein